MLAGVNLTVSLNGVKNYTTDKNGTIKVPTLGLAAGKYTAEIAYDGDEIYNATETDVNVTVNKAGSLITINELPYLVFGDDVNVVFDVLNRTEVDVVIVDNNKRMLVENFSGNIVHLGILYAGNYSITITNLGNQNFSSYTTGINFTVNKKETNIVVLVEDTDYGQEVKGIIVASADGEYDITVGNYKDKITVLNNLGYFNAGVLNSGTYEAIAEFGGSDNYKPNKNSTTFTVDKLKTQISSSKVSATYGTQESLVVTLTDANGNPLVDKSVSIKLNGETYEKTTNSKGQATLKTPKSLDAKTYTATLTFAGDSTYAKSTGSVKVAVSKDKSKISAKAKSFKKSKKTKKYTVTLKASSTSKAIKNAKVTLKVNGKTYSAKTNSKGKATFKITKLTKKGKFTATIKFKGNSYYKSVSKKVKITVKK